MILRRFVYEPLAWTVFAVLSGVQACALPLMAACSRVLAPPGFEKAAMGFDGYVPPGISDPSPLLLFRTLEDYEALRAHDPRAFQAALNGCMEAAKTEKMSTIGGATFAAVVNSGGSGVDGMRQLMANCLFLGMLLERRIRDTEVGALQQVGPSSEG
jgi:hypothetical protein